MTGMQGIGIVCSMMMLPTLCQAQGLSFAADFPRSDGSARAISFTGDRTGNAVNGRLSVDGLEIDVVAQLAKGRVSGEFSVRGREVGRFSAVIVGRELKGSNSLNGKVGAWTIPLGEIPEQARNVLRLGVAD